MTKSSAKRFSILNKLRRMLISTSILVVALAFMALSLREYKLFLESTIHKLQLTADMVGHNSSIALMFDDADTALEILNALQHDRDIVAGKIRRNTGEIFAEYTKAPQSRPGYWPEWLPETQSITRPILHADKNLGEITLVANLRNQYFILLCNAVINFSIVLLAIVVTTITVLRLQRKYMQPILQLADFARGITEKADYRKRFFFSENNEIGDLSEAFNDMLVKIESHEATLESELQKRTEELCSANEKLKELAYYDYLTGLPNRSLFDDRLHQTITQAERNKNNFALIFLDLDKFKQVNDTYGHAVGDELLKAAAERLQQCIRAEDTVSRISGDEFNFLLLNINKPEDATIVAQQIIKCFRQPFLLAAHALNITASLGIGLFPAHGTTSHELRLRADQAMYRAKLFGKNQYSF